MEPTEPRCLSRSPEGTRQLGQTIGRSLSPGDAVLLRGELGTGKTLLARGVAEGLGVTSWRGSPTFTLVNEYRTSPALFHVDLYRLSAMEVQRLGLEDYARPDAILIVEWPERAQDFLTDLLGAARLEVRLEHLGGDLRQITIDDPLGRLGRTRLVLT